MQNIIITTGKAIIEVPQASAATIRKASRRTGYSAAALVRIAIAAGLERMAEKHRFAR